MVGNKTDLLGEVPEKDAKNFANEIGAIFTTTSAKISNGIDELFKTIAKTIALLHPPDKNTPKLINYRTIITLIISLKIVQLSI